MFINNSAKYFSDNCKPVTSGPRKAFQRILRFLNDADHYRMRMVCTKWRDSVDHWLLVHSSLIRRKVRQCSERSDAHLDEALRLKTLFANQNRPIQDSTSLERSRREFREAMLELLAIPPAFRVEDSLRGIYYAAGSIAGRANTPCCLLCLKDTKRAWSHVIPDSVLKRLTHSVSSDGKVGRSVGNIITSGMPNRSLSAAKVTWKLFCKPGCEDLLSRHGEEKFAGPLWKLIQELKKAKTENTGDTIHLREKPGDHFVHYGVASIVFRYMIMNGLNDVRPFVAEHGEKAEHAYWRLFFLLRSYLLDPESSQPPHIRLYVSGEDLETKTMINMVTTLFDNDTGHCYTTGHFEVAGMHFIVTENQEVPQKMPGDFALPKDGFFSVIERCLPPDSLDIAVNAKAVLCLPRAAKRARLFDSAYWIKMAMMQNPVLQGPPGQQCAQMPAHPLSCRIFKLVSQQHCSRLPDELLVVLKKDSPPALRFQSPVKYNLLSHSKYSEDEVDAYVWICRHLHSRKDPDIAVIHVDDKKDRPISFGFHLPSDFSQGKKLKPLRRTSHALIENITHSSFVYTAIIQALK